MLTNTFIQTQSIIYIFIKYSLFLGYLCGLSGVIYGLCLGIFESKTKELEYYKKQLKYQKILNLYTSIKIILFDVIFCGFIFFVVGIFIPPIVVCNLVYLCVKMFF